MSDKAKAEYQRKLYRKADRLERIGGNEARVAALRQLARDVFRRGCNCGAGHDHDGNGYCGY